MQEVVIMTEASQNMDFVVYHDGTEQKKTYCKINKLTQAYAILKLTNFELILPWRQIVFMKRNRGGQE